MAIKNFETRTNLKEKLRKKDFIIYQTFYIKRKKALKSTKQ